jgi:gliding motility-associated-like protein
VFNGISVIIPNVFTPNQDGINEVFSIKTDGITELICEIYDRWGLKMYSWNSPTGFWDGTANGKQCTEGTYYYVVNTRDFKGVAHTYKGYMQLIR